MRYSKRLRTTTALGAVLALSASSSLWAATFNITESDDLSATVASAASGDTINLADGMYTLSGSLSILKALTITGASENGVIIDASGNGTGYGIQVRADDVTLSNFTLNPPVVSASLGSSGGGGFAIHASYDNTGAENDSFDNLTLSDITINNGNRTPFDVHGYDGVTLQNLTATGSAYGNGIQVSGCQDVTFSNCTTSGNEWGGIAVYVSRDIYLSRGSSNVDFDWKSPLSR
jgi:parallel beta-helix repeat protein